MSDFKTQFNESLGTRGLSSAKISELTGVPERYIEFLRIGHYEALPPAPYVRGYLNKIATVMGGDAEEWWLAYQLEFPNYMSGPSDKLPQNRFVLKKISKGKIGLAILLAAALFYGAARFNDVIGKPYLNIENPAAATLISQTNRLTISGGVKAGDKLTINGEGQYVDESGHFKKDIELYPGVNVLEFKVKRTLGREVDEIRKVIYQPNSVSESANNATSTPAGQ